MTATGIIFSNLHDKNLPELTQRRTLASIPFACRYRLVDFPLSNMTNAGIKDISVITHYNYYSLMEHIGSGKDWDLARRRGGIKLLSPFITAYANQRNELYNSRLEALMSINETISGFTEDYVVLSDCDGICNIDLSDMLRAHAASGAVITMAVKKMRLSREGAKKRILVSSDKNGRITDISIHPTDFSGNADVNINIWVVNRDYLQNTVANAEAHGFKSFSRDIILRNLATEDYRIYRFDGYCASINSLLEYYRTNMEIVNSSEIRSELFNINNRPIFTHVRNSAPTVHAAGASVKNSLIADGCVIEGTVENSVLFRGVKIGKGTVVRNSILFMDTYTGKNVSLNCVIADKKAVFTDGVCLSGHESLPFYIDKGRQI